MPLRLPKSLNKSMIFLILLTLLFSLSSSEPRAGRPPEVARIAIRATEIRPQAFQGRRAPGVPLRLAKAWRLDSDNVEFGGISALVPFRGGLLGVSDAGVLVETRPTPELANWFGQISPIPASCVRSTSKFDRDSESLAVDPAGSRYWLGLEYHNRICAVVPGGGAHFVAPKAMRKWPMTGGPEAMVRLADGRFLVFAERSHPPEATVPMLVFDRDPTDPSVRVTKARYRPPPGFTPVDAAQLPDGRVLVLHRRFQLPFAFSAILSIGTLNLSARGASLQTKPVTWLDAGLGADNWEALAVEDRGHGRATLWLANDNNFMLFEPNYLLRLEWGAPSPRQ